MSRTASIAPPHAAMWQVLPWFISLAHHGATRTLASHAAGGPMSDATDRSKSNPPAKPLAPVPPAQDPSDLGTAYGMEMSIEAPTGVPAEDDLNDPLGWIRRWVERHKPA
jgi:hypothetical protein